jgi:hypothetical protein
VTVTISWVDAMTADLVELDVDEDVAEAIGRGGPVTWAGARRPRRSPRKEARGTLVAKKPD